jgi:hypothetical protein
MPLQFRRGLESARTTITPSIGEALYTTDTKKLYIGDGNTPGGISVNTDTTSFFNSISVSGFDDIVAESGGTSLGVSGDANINIETNPVNSELNITLADKVNSSSKRLVIPKMTTTQINALSDASIGEIVYDTTLDVVKIYVSTEGSTEWVTITTS